MYQVLVLSLSSSHLEIEQVINYPNPVRGEHTWFTFFLSKQAVVRIKIYTVSGRLIRTMGPDNWTPGLNQAYWDTRDELGNRIGNGIYIYKIEAESEGLSKEETSKISKLMILR
jgi:flagellar hook assembly protein FlgD